MKSRSLVFWLLLLALVGGGGVIFLVVLVMALSPKSGGGFLSSPVVVTKLEGQIFDSLELIRELDELGDDDHVKAVVLRINSPGGAVGPSQEIYRQVLKLKEKGKKVVVSMGTVAASGGYYIASAADKIVASPGTITGSIGVIMQSFGLKDAADFLKVEPRVIKSGRYKDAGSPFRDVTDDERAYFQNLSDDMYGQFLADIATARGIPLDDVRAIAEGRIYSGKQAQALKLVDELGNLFDAIELAKKEAGLNDDARVKWPREPSPVEKFFAGDGAGASLQKLLLPIGTGEIPLWLMDAKSFPAVR